MTYFGLSLRAARAGLTGVTVVALLAGVGLAVHRTTVTTRTTRPAASVFPATVPAPTPTGPTVDAGAAPLPVASQPPQVAATSSAPSSGPTTAASAPPVSGVPTAVVAAIGKCPIALATPKHMGGVQSLVSFAPAFGPFSAEAFAAAAAYQPELELLGPILAQYPAYAPILEPLLTPVLALFSTGSNSLFAAIEPLYKPYRTEVLSAETKLAAALAPYSVQLAGTPLAGCVVDLEAALVGDTDRTKKSVYRIERH